MINLLLLVRVT